MQICKEDVNSDEKTNMLTDQEIKQANQETENPKKSNEENYYQRCKAWIKLNRYKIIGPLFIAFGVWLIILTVTANEEDSQQIYERPAPPQFHHSFFYIETEGYTKREILKWQEDADQHIGGMKLLDGTHILIPQDGLYMISCIVQLKVDKNTSSRFVTLLAEIQKNGNKDNKITKESTHSLNIPEYSTMRLQFTSKCQANETIFFTMEDARFINKDANRSYLYITSLHLDNTVKYKP
ncbi:uncharacterized protein LOC106880432 [Octopus bimaculoides]|uniref:THD domain-containing protein n=1 Tax=Octopus bimaculoides TaxID=37653 RepID=A0A0L8FY84_OCTBM|nr:uncharacterized protein LOC106880432 [Octopus bimaculoides]|eukprot:XP_014785840.1 PREDICTED: uncharacterized protein LOC106880432 [Octopus bimaculoides]